MAKQFHAQSYTGIKIISGAGGAGYPSSETLPVYDPVQLAEELGRTGIADPSSFLGLANSFTHVMGRNPSQGWFLMLYEDAIKLDMDNCTNQVQFTEQTKEELDAKRLEAPLQGRTIDETLYIKNLCVHQIVGVTALVGKRIAGEELNKQMYLVQLSDQRSLAHLSSIAKAYNIRTPAHSPDGYLGACEFINTATKTKAHYVLDSGALQCMSPNEDPYYVTTTNGSSPWSWKQMILDIWAHLPAGLFQDLDTSNANFPKYHWLPEDDPTLPALPVEDIAMHPENYAFWGISAWDALNRVLADIDHTVVRTHDGSWTIVDTTQDDHAFKSLLFQAEDHILDLASPLKFGGAGTFPEKIRVFFPRRDFAWQEPVPVVESGAGFTDPNVVTPQDRWKCAPLYKIDVPILEAVNWPVGEAETVTGNDKSKTRCLEEVDRKNPDVSVNSIKGSIYSLHSSTYAHFDDAGNLTNSEELISEAYYLAAGYVQAKSNFGMDSFDQITFSGLWKFGSAEKKQLGHLIRSVTWSDTGGGFTTTILSGQRDSERGRVSGSTGGGGFALSNGGGTALEFPGPPEVTRPHEPVFRMVECQLLEKLEGSGFATANLLYAELSGGGQISWLGSEKNICLHQLDQTTIIPSGTKLFATWEKQIRQWVVAFYTPTPPCLIQFELTENLDQNGCAMAKVLACSSSELEVDAPIPVEDVPASVAGVLPHGGTFGPAVIGDRGTAFRAGGCVTGVNCDSGGCKYTILYMEHQPIFAKLTIPTGKNLSTGTMTGLSSSDFSPSWQGRDGVAGTTHTVKDLCGVYADAIESSCLIVSYDESESTPTLSVWNILDGVGAGAARVCLVRFELTADLGLGGCAMAKVLECSAGGLAVGAAIPVEDNTTGAGGVGGRLGGLDHTGMFGPAEIGDRGTAFRPTCEVDLTCGSDGCLYEIINMEHQPIFAVATLTEDWDEEIFSNNATITLNWQGRSEVSNLPNKVIDHLELYNGHTGIGDKFLVCFQEITSTTANNEWAIVDGPHLIPHIVRFELTASLSLGGSTTAKLLDCSGGSMLNTMPEGTVITVTDFTVGVGGADGRGGTHTHTGLFGPAIVGDRGVAFRASLGDGCDYTIIYMEHNPYVAIASLLGSLSGGAVAATLSGAGIKHWQGRDDPDNDLIQVRDLLGIYGHLGYGDKVCVSYDETDSTVGAPIWNIIDAEELKLWYPLPPWWPTPPGDPTYPDMSELCADIGDIATVAGYSSTATIADVDIISVNKDCYLRLFVDDSDPSHGLISMDPVGNDKHAILYSANTSIRWSQCPEVGLTFTIGSDLASSGDKAWLKLEAIEAGKVWNFSADSQASSGGDQNILTSQKWLAPSQTPGGDFLPGSNLTIDMTGGEAQGNDCLKLRWTKAGIGNGVDVTITGIHTDLGYYINLFLDDGIIWAVQNATTAAILGTPAIARTDSGAANCSETTCTTIDPCPPD